MLNWDGRALISAEIAKRGVQDPVLGMITLVAIACDSRGCLVSTRDWRPDLHAQHARHALLPEVDKD